MFKFNIVRKNNVWQLTTTYKNCTWTTQHLNNEMVVRYMKTILNK